MWYNRAHGELSMSVASAEWRDPGPMMRLAALQMDPMALSTVAEWVAGGGTLREFAREKKLPRGPLLVWLMSDEARWGLYRRALVAGGFAEADEMKEIAEGLPRQARGVDGEPVFDEKTGKPVIVEADVARDKLRADVLRFRASKHASEFYGERVDMVHHRALPSETELLARLDALIAGRPQLLDALLERRARLASPVDQTAEAAHTAPITEI